MLMLKTSEAVIGKSGHGGGLWRWGIVHRSAWRNNLVAVCLSFAVLKDFFATTFLATTLTFNLNKTGALEIRNFTVSVDVKLLLHCCFACFT